MTRYAVVKNGVVDNIIVTRPAYKLGLESALESRLIALSDDMLVQIGDIHDAEAGVFLRDGVDVSDDDTLKVLRARVVTAEQAAAALEEENTLLKAQIQAVADRGEFVEDVIAEMAMKVYAG